MNNRAILNVRLYALLSMRYIFFEPDKVDYKFVYDVFFLIKTEFDAQTKITKKEYVQKV